MLQVTRYTCVVDCIAVDLRWCIGSIGRYTNIIPILLTCSGEGSNTMMSTFYSFNSLESQWPLSSQGLGRQSDINI